MPDQVGPRRVDRFVGMFYWLWHGFTRTSPIRDVTKELEIHPAAPEWAFQDWYWGEPEDGYYHACDPWVARRNLQLLANAGVDFIFLDFTNGAAPSGKECLAVLAGAAMDMTASGIPVPRFVPFLNADGDHAMLDWLWREVYSPGKYQDWWFRWDGKPLLLHGQPQLITDAAMRAFFTVRTMWAFQQDQHDQWRFIDNYPQRPSWHADPATPEQICVGKAMGAPLVPVGAKNDKGSSFHAGVVPAYDAKWLCPDTPKGLYFEEQWTRARTIDPPIVTVTGWNELTAGAWHADGPGLSFLGRPLAAGGWYFVDEFNQEFNRDIQPMKGGYTDNYYYQLVAQIRRFKGADPAPTASPPRTMFIDGIFADWADVQPIFRDARGDAAHRSFRNVDGSAMLVNDTGRNDIVEARVAHDDATVAFYAKTAQPLTAPGAANWMLLFIDADRDKKTGWQGYDLVVGLGGAHPPRTPVSGWNGSAWQEVGAADVAVGTNELEVAVPKSLLGVGSSPRFDLHWADNMQNTSSITEFFISGDSAPDRRFDYRYEGQPVAVSDAGFSKPSADGAWPQDSAPPTDASDAPSTSDGGESDAHGDSFDGPATDGRPSAAPPAGGHRQSAAGCGCALPVSPASGTCPIIVCTTMCAVLRRRRRRSSPSGATSGQRQVPDERSVADHRAAVRPGAEPIAPLSSRSPRHSSP